MDDTIMKLLLDTDIGSDIDDALALLLCLHLPDISLKAVTTVYGNVELRAKIAKKLLRLVGLEIPVAIGEAEPLSSPMKIWHSGTEGKGILELEEVIAPAAESGVLPDAVDLMIRTARECSGELEIVSIGPLTNLATAIEKDPSFAKNVRRIWAMIGGITYPDTPPQRPLIPYEAFIAKPSHNVRCDVAAARVVLDSGVPLVMVGNDVTTRVRIRRFDLPRVEQEGSAFNSAVIKMMHVWLDYRSEIFERRVNWTCMHDALVVAEACGYGFTERDPVEVKLFEDGATQVLCVPESRIEVCRTVDKERFEKWYLDVVAGEV